MKNTQKGFAVPLVLALIALVAAGGGYAIVKNKKAPVVPEKVAMNEDSTASASSTLDTDWNTYRNEQYGFEVKYPSVGKVAVGTHYGGGIQDPGEVQFAIVYKKDAGLEQGGIITFSVKPTAYVNNGQLVSAEQKKISENPNIRNAWKVSQANFLDMGNAVIVSEQKAKGEFTIGCLPTGTLAQSVSVVRAPNLFTFDDYRCEQYAGLPLEIMKTFRFIDAKKEAVIKTDSAEKGVTPAVDQISWKEIAIPTNNPGDTLSIQYPASWDQPEYVGNIVCQDSEAYKDATISRPATRVSGVDGEVVYEVGFCFTPNPEKVVLAYSGFVKFMNNKIVPVAVSDTVLKSTPEYKTAQEIIAKNITN